jgi:hypothetical protein
MPDNSQTNPAAFNCEGGLVLNKSTFLMQPGEALELRNFEPDIEGGYRRINGFSKYVSAVVPSTSSATEKILMVASFADVVLAARGTSIYSATPGGSSWTSRDSGRTSAGKYSFERFNFDGTDKIVVVDGVNAPTVFNSSLAATDVGDSSVAGSKFVASFQNHMFYAGKATTKQEVIFSQPFDEDAFSSGSGAGSFKVDDTVVGLKVFRDDLFVFCETRIFKLSGSSSTNFAVTAVTRNIGCVNGDTIQEFAGDLIFLGPDGLRTIAGTARIGDVELGTISSNVQSIFNDNLSSASEFDSTVIPDKTQYRIFFTKSTVGENQSKGVICVLKGQQFEFSELRGIRPACTDSFVDEGNVLVLHGAYTSGYIYRQESGNTFDGEVILGRYRSPDLTFDDPGIRKHMQRVILNYKPEAAIDADLILRYDYEDPDSARPAVYPLDSEDVVAIYGTSTYGVPIYAGASQPLVRQPVEGSGFAVALKIHDGGETAPYSLKGFQLEYQLGARR